MHKNFVGRSRASAVHELLPVLLTARIISPISNLVGIKRKNRSRTRGQESRGITGIVILKGQTRRGKSILDETKAIGTQFFGKRLRCLVQIGVTAEENKRANILAGGRT